MYHGKYIVSNLFKNLFEKFVKLKKQVNNGVRTINRHKFALHSSLIYPYTEKNFQVSIRGKTNKKKKEQSLPRESFVDRY